MSRVIKGPTAIGEFVQNVELDAHMCRHQGEDYMAVPSGAGAGAGSAAAGPSSFDVSLTPWPRQRGHEFRPVVNHCEYPN
jgi:hypothetical protein